MIKIENLTKIYNSRKRKKCKALDNINLVLPDNGLVFILGKSGSGKSTLLNLIAGLDKITSGKITVNGNEVSKFKRKEYYNYRSSNIGFIFQHYYLLEDLTVYQNIKLALDIINQKNKKQIYELIEKVGLKGKDHKFPTELSGGEQQRVAIARALIKNPSLILADEPTGNLDKNTSEQVLKILKEASKKSLIIIVSHNKEEADLYADRIIELHEGKIIEDKERLNINNKEFKIENNTLFLPYSRGLSNVETQKMLEGLQSNKITNILQQNNGFVDTNNNYFSDKKEELASHKVKRKTLYKYAKVFLKKRKKNNRYVIIMTTLLFITIAVLTSFLSSSKTSLNIDKNDETVLLHKGELMGFDESFYSTPIYEITQEEQNKINESGYEGQLNYLYTDQLGAGTTPRKLTFNTIGDFSRNQTKLYAVETYGLLNCDEQYLINKFGIDGKLNLLAGELESTPYGIIITDFMADSILYFKKNMYSSYESIIGKYPKVQNTNYINAIIDTDYEEKYKSLFNQYQDIKTDEEALSLQKELKDDSLYISFINDCMYKYALSYNINPNYKNDVKTYLKTSYVYLRGVTYYKDDGTMYSLKPSMYNTFRYDSNNAFKLEDNEIVIDYLTYNKIFETGYNSINYTEFKPQKIILKMHEGEDPNNPVIRELEFNIKKLTNSYTYVNKNTFGKVLEFVQIPFGVMFENNETTHLLMDQIDKTKYYDRDIDNENEMAINKMISILIVFFQIFQIAIYVFLFFYLVSYGINNIKKNYYEVGIMSALGFKTKDIGKIMITNVLISGVYICILSSIISPLVIYLSDKLLVSSFALVLDLHIYNLSIIDSSALLLTKDLSIIVGTTILSAFLPMFSLYRLKPIEIINSKDK